MAEIESRKRILRAPGDTLAPPVQVRVRALSTGTHVIKWKRGSRRRDTDFVVEMCVSESGEWNFLGSTADLKYNHMGPKPEGDVSYRVRTRQGEQISTSSEEVTVYAVQQEDLDSSRNALAALHPMTILRYRNANRVLR